MKTKLLSLLLLLTISLSTISQESLYFRDYSRVNKSNEVIVHEIKQDGNDEFIYKISSASINKSDSLKIDSITSFKFQYYDDLYYFLEDNVKRSVVKNFRIQSDCNYISGYHPSNQEIDLRLRQSSNLLIQSQNRALLGMGLSMIGTGTSLILFHNNVYPLSYISLVSFNVVGSVFLIDSLITKRKAYKKLRLY
jgi:hypothetical protein